MDANPGASRRFLLWCLDALMGPLSRRFLQNSTWRVKASPGAGLVNRGFKCRGIIPRIRGMDGMAASSSEQIRTSLRGIGARQVRLVSGCILFAYVLSHFLKHALGNISLEAMADGVRWHTAFWQFL